MGVPLKWMVYVMENPTKMDENWGYPYDLGNLHRSIFQSTKKAINHHDPSDSRRRAAQSLACRTRTKSGP